MKTIKLKKLHKGLAEVRSHVYDILMDRGEGIVFEHGGERMTVSPEDMDRGFVTARGIKSKFDGRVFDLISFKWESDGS